MNLKKLGLSFILAFTMLCVIEIILYALTKFPVVVGCLLIFSALWCASYQLIKMLGD